jgi:Mg2+ and Co2+ transporter CorA
MKPKNCYQVAKGRGFCDYCGDERPELCRYTNTPGAIALIEKLTKEVEKLQGLVDSAKTSNPYRFKKDGGTISEVGQWDEGKLERIKFNTPVKILTNQPTWVALGHRIVELEAQLSTQVRCANKNAEIIRKLTEEKDELQAQVNDGRKRNEPSESRG